MSTVAIIHWFLYLSTFCTPTFTTCVSVTRKLHASWASHNFVKKEYQICSDMLGRPILELSSACYTNQNDQLIRCGPITHIWVDKLTCIGSDNGLSCGGHYLSQWWDIVNLSIRNKLLWNLNRHSCIFIKEIIWKCRLEYGDRFFSASMY